MYSCVMRDDTPQAVAAAAAEKHVPLGLECRQSAWAYSIPGFTDFNVVKWHIFNRSGHELDRVVRRLPRRHGRRPDRQVELLQRRLRRAACTRSASSSSRRRTPTCASRSRGTHPAVPDVDPDSALCPRLAITVQGFSVADDDGDEQQDARRAVVPADRPHHRSAGGERPEARGLPRVPLVPGRAAVRAGRQSHDRPAALRVDDRHDNIVQRRHRAPACSASSTRTRATRRATTRRGRRSARGVHWPADGELECTFALGVRPGNLKLAQSYAADYLACGDDAGAHRSGDRRADDGGRERHRPDRQVPVARQRARGAARVRGLVRAALDVAAAHRLPRPRDRGQGAAGPGAAAPGLRERATWRRGS